MYLVRNSTRARREPERAGGNVTLPADLLAQIIKEVRNYAAYLNCRNTDYGDDLITERMSDEDYDLLCAYNTRRIKELKRLAARLEKEAAR